MKFSEYFGAWIRAYYASVPLGRDFYTAVSASKFFGGAIAKYILENLERGNMRLPLNIIDLGGNNANLLNDIRAFLGALGDGVAEECEFVLIDSRFETSASRLPLKDLANFGHSQTPSLASYQKFAKNSQIKPTNLGSRESGDSRKSCHFERSEKSFLNDSTPPPNPLPQGEGEVKSPILADGNLMQEGVAPLNPKNCDSREFSKISPTANSKSCVRLGNSNESKQFLPTFSKSRWGLWRSPALSKDSPSPKVKCVWRGLGGGVSQNKLKSKNSKNSQESKRFFAYAQNDKISADCHESASADFRNDSIDSNESSESNKIFRLSPQNDNFMLDCHNFAMQNIAMTDLTTSHALPQNKPICANIKAYPNLESFMHTKLAQNRHNIFIANELFDALPCEIIDNDKMAFVENNRLNFKPCNDKKILEICKEFNIIKGEIPLIYDEICECIKDIKFMFIAFDYGDIAPRNDFTVRLFRTHKIEQFLKIDDFSQLFGHCDITYNVPFFVLDKAFERIGAKKILLKRQDSVLIEDFKILEIFSQFCKYKRESNCTSRAILHETNKLKTLLHNLSPKFWCAIYKNF